MATVRSNWTNRPIEPTGILSVPEWHDAGLMPIPAGFLMVLNDAAHLYLALDMVRDCRSDATEDDYFWFSVDIGADGQITPHLDVNYAPYRTYEDAPDQGAPAVARRRRIGRKLYTGPNDWTDFVDDPEPNYACVGFAPSPSSAERHRVWEMRLRLVEMQASTRGPAAILRFGLRIASMSSTFTFDYPPSFASDFSSLHEIHLAASPAG